MFKGLSAFPITPSDADGVVQTDALQRILARLEGSGVASVGLLGSTGTYMFLSRAERQRAVAAAREVLTDLPLIVGVGAMRTSEAVALAKDAQAAGADALLMAPVSYNPLTEEEVAQHYMAVAAATDLPFCIYNNPGTTNFTFSYALLARLAQIDTVQAVKMPLPADGDFKAVMEALPDHLEVGFSGDWGMGDAFLSGAGSFYSAIAGTLPAPLVALVEAAVAGDAARVQALSDELSVLWDLCKTVGSVRVAHALAREMGLITTSLPRPLLDLDGAARAQVRGLAQQFGVDAG